MRVCVIGAGAIGLLFAGKCALAHHSVLLITRTSEQSQWIDQDGIRLIEKDRVYPIDLPCISIEAAARKKEFQHGPWDWIFLTVKQQHLDTSLMEFIAEQCGRETNLVCFQNGIGHVERLQQYLPAEKIYVAVTSEAALREKPNEVHHTGTGVTWIGSAITTNTDIDVDIHDGVKNLVNGLQDAGFTTHSSKNIHSIVWNKLIINATINPLTAILRVYNGELIQSAEWLKVMKALYQEARMVADHLRIKLPASLWEQLIEVCHRTAKNKSSMLQDMLQGRKTEIDWINGQILRYAEQLQLDVPTHRTIYQLIKGMEPSD